MFQWVKGNAYTMITTVSPNYVTLNNVAANHFKDVKWCLVGFDETEKKMAIKPISKNDIDLNIYPLENLHKVSVGTGYARISNKTIMQTLATLSDYPLSDNVKYTTSFDEKENMLIVDLNSKEA